MKSRTNAISYDRLQVFEGLVDRKLPDMFMNKVIIDEEYDISQWDQLSQMCIRIGREEGLLAAWDKVIEEDGVNHVLITGRPYVGKTSMGLSLAVAISEKYNQMFDERNCLGGRAVVLTPELIKEVFEHIEDFTNFIIFIDEIQHAFNRMRATAEINVEANKFYDAIRKMGIHTISTAPTRHGVDRSIVEEKILWWIHCYFKDKRKKIVKAIVYFNACSESGQTWDFVEVERLTFDWVDPNLYWKVTEQISHEKIFNVAGLENYREERKKYEKKGKESKLEEKIQKIMRTNLSRDKKAFQLLNLGLPIASVEAHTQLSYTRVKRIKAMKQQGKKLKDIVIVDKRLKGG